jgi:hypothetical protein
VEVHRIPVPLPCDDDGRLADLRSDDDLVAPAAALASEVGRGTSLAARLPRRS